MLTPKERRTVADAIVRLHSLDIANGLATLDTTKPGVIPYPTLLTSDDWRWVQRFSGQSVSAPN